MASDIAVPYAWRAIVCGDVPFRRLYVLTTLPKHPHIPGFDADVKKELLDAAASAASAHGLDAVVIWEIRPTSDPACVSEWFQTRRARPARKNHPRRRRTDFADIA